MSRLKFVVHEHHASRLHFDFRLEAEGVLKSWAIPKGPSMNPAEKRLAIAVSDHPIEYGDFEGIIPEGHYGAGAVVIWDKGYYEASEGIDAVEGLKKGSLKFRLYGEKLKGDFSLIKLKGPKVEGKEWLLIKKADQYSDSGFSLQKALTLERKNKLNEIAPPCEAD